MAKKFFRFLRGELNGYYLQKINEALNKGMQDNEEFLADFSRMVFKTSVQVGAGEYPIPSAMLYGLGTFAGVFPPRVPQDSLVGSLRFTTSHKVQGNEVSDEGLFEISTEAFRFPNSYNPALYTHEGAGRNASATNSLRTSLVEKGATILGFFKEGDKVIKDDGSIDLSLLVVPTVPYAQWLSWADEQSEAEQKVYYPFYGQKYLYLAEESPIVASTGDNVFLELIKAMQYVRYNGVSVKSLCEFAHIMCSSYLFITSIEWNDNRNYGIVNYGIDEDYDTTDKLLRTEVFKMIVKMKFKQYAFNEQRIAVTRDDEGNVIDVTVITNGGN